MLVEYDLASSSFEGGIALAAPPAPIESVAIPLAIAAYASSSKESLLVTGRCMCVCV